MMGGEEVYRKNPCRKVLVNCPGRYVGEGKFCYFCIHPSQSTDIEELRNTKMFVGVMIPNGNVWEYPIETVIEVEV